MEVNDKFYLPPSGLLKDGKNKTKQTHRASALSSRIEKLEPEKVDRLGEKKSVIEIIGAQREKNLIKQVCELFKHRLGLGGRGKHVFIGHTGIHLKRAEEDISTGFTPRTVGFIDILKFIFKIYVPFLMNQPAVQMEGQWSEQENALLHDPKLKRFGMKVSEEVAQEFEKHLEIAKNEIHTYSLQPGSENSGINLYVFEKFENITPAKIRGKSIVLIKDAENYKVFYIEKHKFITDNQGNHIIKSLKLSQQEEELISKSDYGKIKKNTNRMTPLNTLINNATEKTDVPWKAEFISKNCVNAAVNIFVDFFLEYRDKENANGHPYFTQQEKIEIEAMLNDILTTISHRFYTGQGALIHNIDAWEKSRLKRSST